MALPQEPFIKWFEQAFCSVVPALIQCCRCETPLQTEELQCCEEAGGAKLLLEHELVTFIWAVYPSEAFYSKPKKGNNESPTPFPHSNSL